MKIDLDVIEKLLFESDYSAWDIGKETGLTRQTVLRYRNKEADYLNMKLVNAIKLIEYYNMKETIKMKDSKLKEMVMEMLNDLDEEIRGNLFEWYYEPSTNTVAFEDAGMEYSGDDSDKEYLFQTENGEII